MSLGIGLFFAAAGDGYSGPPPIPPDPNPLIAASSRLLLEVDSGLAPPTGPNIAGWGSQVDYGSPGQATTGNQPDYEENIFNALPGIKFVASNNDSLIIDEIGSIFGGTNTPLTLLMAFRTPSTFGTQIVFSVGHSLGNPRMSFGITSSGRLQIIRRDDSGASVTATGTASELAISTNYVISYVFSGTAISARINKTVSSSINNVTMSVGSLTLSRSAVGILRSSTSSGPFNGHLGALSLYNAELTGTDLTDKEDYLIEKYL